ncbi:hypothetical protein QJS10_CPB13g00077 [Acorus calamus]|uniref:Uncharacterized protein n=1 Tax=Acorus calamus TaxID=4465 RepID=A0AAV9DIX2_ACOCL|nr:hypothetical protein QJS10_CPB13g00077 [Acorus calamus]
MSGTHHNRVHSILNVPFSWENKPGVSKTAASMESNKVADQTSPPSESPKLFLGHGGLPPPPCASQPLQLRSNSKKVIKKEDPFLKAYMECTKSVACADRSKRDRKRPSFSMSCKHSTGVRDDVLVRMSRPPPPQSSPSLYEQRLWDGE